MDDKPITNNPFVFCRLKPVPKDKRVNVTYNDADDTTLQVGGKKYNFQKVFPPDSTQKYVFAGVWPALQASLRGNSTTLMTYGQVGSGKTHTLFNIDSPEHDGIASQAVTALLADPTVSSLGMQFVHIYKDQVFDLLSTEEMGFVDIIYDEVSGVQLQRATKVTLTDYSTFSDAVTRGCSRLVTLNARGHKNNRSHSVLSITLLQEDHVLSKLLFVDLAGFVRTDQRAELEKEEVKLLNSSLLALGNVITCLGDGSVNVPYDHSCLTRLLRDSLRGLHRLVVMITLDPQAANMQDTIASLYFGNRVSRVELSSNVVDPQYMRLAKRLQERIESEEGRVNELQAQQEELKQRRDQIQEQCCKELQMLQNVKRQVQVAQNGPYKLNSPTEIEKVVESCQKEVQQLQEQHELEKDDITDAFNTEIQTLQNRIKQLVEHHTDEVGALHSQISDLSSSLDKQEETLSVGREHEISMKDTEIGMLSDQIAFLKAKFSKLTGSSCHAPDVLDHARSLSERLNQLRDYLHQHDPKFARQKEMLSAQRGGRPIVHSCNLFSQPHQQQQPYTRRHSAHHSRSRSSHGRRSPTTAHRRTVVGGRYATPSTSSSPRPTSPLSSPRSASEAAHSRAATPTTLMSPPPAIPPIKVSAGKSTILIPPLPVHMAQQQQHLHPHEHLYNPAAASIPSEADGIRSNATSPITTPRSLLDSTPPLVHIPLYRCCTPTLTNDYDVGDSTADVDELRFLLMDRQEALSNLMKELQLQELRCTQQEREQRDLLEHLKAQYFEMIEDMHNNPSNPEIQKRIKNMEATIQSKDASIQQHKKDLEHNSKVLADVHEQMGKLKDEIADKGEEVSKLTEELHTKAGQLEATQQALNSRVAEAKEKDGQIAHLQAQLQDKESVINGLAALQQALKEATAAQQAKDEEARILRDELSILRDELNIKTGRLSVLQEDDDNAENAKMQLEGSKRDLMHANQQVDDLLRSNITLKLENQSLNGQLKQTYDELTASLMELEKLRAMEEELVGARKMSEQQQEHMSLLLQKLDDDGRLHADLATTKQTLGLKEEALGNAQAELAKLTAEHQDVKRKNANLESDIKQLKKSLSSAYLMEQAHLEKVQDAVTAAEEQCAEKDKQIGALEDELSSTTQNLQDCRGKLEQMEEKLDVVEQQLENFQQQAIRADELEELLVDKTAELNALKTTADDNESNNNEGISWELQVREAEVMSLRKLVAALQDEKAQLENHSPHGEIYSVGGSSHNSLPITSSTLAHLTGNTRHAPTGPPAWSQSSASPLTPQHSYRGRGEWMPIQQDELTPTGAHSRHLPTATPHTPPNRSPDTMDLDALKRELETKTKQMETEIGRVSQTLSPEHAVYPIRKDVKAPSTTSTTTPPTNLSLEDARTQLAAQEETIAQLQGMLEEVHQRLAEAPFEKVDDLVVENATLQDANHSLMDQLSLLEAAVQPSSDKGSVINSLNKLIQQQRDSLADKDAQIKRLTAQKHDGTPTAQQRLLDLLEVQTKKYEAAQSQLLASQKQVQHLQQTASELQRKLNTTEEENNQLSNDLLHLQRKLSRGNNVTPSRPLGQQLAQQDEVEEVPVCCKGMQTDALPDSETSVTSLSLSALLPPKKAASSHSLKSNASDSLPIPSAFPTTERDLHSANKKIAQLQQEIRELKSDKRKEGQQGGGMKSGVAEGAKDMLKWLKFGGKKDTNNRDDGSIQSPSSEPESEEDLRRLLAQYKDDIVKLQAALSNFSQDAGQLNQQQQPQHNDVVTLQDQLSKAQHDNTELQERCQNMEHHLQQLEHQQPKHSSDPNTNNDGSLLQAKLEQAIKKISYQKAEISALRAQLDNVHNDLLQQRKSHTDASEELLLEAAKQEELGDTPEQLQQRCARQSVSIKRLLEDVDQLEKQLKQANKDTASKDKELNNFSEDKENMEKAMVDLHKTVKTLEAEQQAQRATTTVTGITSAAAAARGGLTEFSGSQETDFSISDGQSTPSPTIQQQHSPTTTTADLQDENERLKALLRQQGGDIADEALNEMSKLVDTIKLKDAHINTLKGEVNKLKLQCKELQQENERLTTTTPEDTEELHGDVQAAHTRVKKLEAEIHELSEAANKAQGFETKAQRLEQELKAITETATSEMKEMKDALLQYRALLQKRADETTGLKNFVTRISSEATRLQDIIGRMQQQLTARDLEIQRLHETIALLQPAAST